MLRKITQCLNLITKTISLVAIIALIAWGITVWGIKSAKQELLFKKMMEPERINYNPHFRDPGIIQLKESNEK